MTLPFLRGPGSEMYAAMQPSRSIGIDVRIAQGSLPLLALLTIVFCCAVAGVVAAWF